MAKIYYAIKCIFTFGRYNDAGDTYSEELTGPPHTTKRSLFGWIGQANKANPDGNFNSKKRQYSYIDSNRYVQVKTKK